MFKAVRGDLVGFRCAPRLVEVARTFLGVPFKHRGRNRRGLDCAGLVWCAYAEAGVIHPDLKKYGREPHQNGMMRVVVEALGEPVRGKPEVGDVLVLRFEIEPHHMAIVGTDPHYGLSMIHADGSPSVRRVVEHGLDKRWFDRIVAIFRRPV